jgi:phosphoribosyl 1,2-cyclic phosphate phosphodiesterase
MGLEENVLVKNKMIELGYADENTVFISNHFSHNGTNVFYDDFMPIAAKEGFITSFDGMTIEL